MLGLFFGGRKFQASFGNEYGNIELDAVFEETHEWSADATSNPVENDAPVTDHVIEQPDKVKLRCFVTDAPLNASSSMEAFANSIVGTFGGNTRAHSNRTQTAFDLLYELMKQKLETTIYTKHRTYDDMIVTNVTIPRAASDGEALEFTAEFMHIRKVATQTVDVPDGISSKKEAKAGGANGSVAKKAEPTKAVGNKQTEPAGSNSSVLGKLLGSTK